jgi:hypothetical protein
MDYLESLGRIIIAGLVAAVWRLLGADYSSIIGLRSKDLVRLPPVTTPSEDCDAEFSSPSPTLIIFTRSKLFGHFVEKRHLTAAKFGATMQKRMQSILTSVSNWSWPYKYDPWVEDLFKEFTFSISAIS